MVKNKDNVVIGDLGVVKEKGVGYFYERRPWPVSESEFRKFSDDIKSLYLDSVKNCNNEMLTDIALIEMVFVTQLVNIFHFNYAKEYCIKKSLYFDVSKESESLLNPDWKAIGKMWRINTFPHGRLIRLIRRIVKGYSFNRHLSILTIVRKIFSNDKVVSVGSYDRIKREYVEHNNILCDHYDWPDLVNKAKKKGALNKKGSYSKSDFKELVENKIINPFLAEIIIKHKKFSKGIDLYNLKEAWIMQFTDAYELYCNLKLIKKPKTLLVTEVAKPFSKILTLSFQKSGCKVLNFSHGNDAGLLRQKWAHHALISHCDKYVFETNEICNRFKKSSNDRKIEKQNKTEYSNVNSSYYLTIRQLKVNNHNSYKKRVMLMGYPMNLYRDLDEGYMFFDYKFRLEVYLAKTLHAFGHTVVYKAHPDRLKEISGLMDDFVHEIIADPFEKVWRKAEVLIFTYVSTTTFCYALNLPIPIVLVEVEGSTPWYNDMKDLVEKRVAIVSAKIDSDIDLSNNEFIKAIDVAKDRVDLNIARQITG
jgi:hypothetical protein